MAKEIVVDTGHEKKLFTVKESEGRLYIYNYHGHQIGKTRDMEDAIALIKEYVKSKGHRVGTVSVL